MRNTVKKAPTLYLHASFNLQQSWMVCVAAPVSTRVVTSWKGVDSPLLHWIWNAVWIGLEKSGKRAKLISVLKVHFHLLGAHSTLVTFSLYFTAADQLTDNNFSYRLSPYKFKGQLAMNKEVNTAFPKRILKAYYTQNNLFFSQVGKLKSPPPQLQWNFKSFFLKNSSRGFFLTVQVSKCIHTKLPVLS